MEATQTPDILFSKRPQGGTKKISVIACHTSIAVFFSAAATKMARILHKTT
jgi:hypothetical protein